RRGLRRAVRRTGRRPAGKASGAAPVRTDERSEEGRRRLTAPRSERTGQIPRGRGTPGRNIAAHLKGLGARRYLTIVASIGYVRPAGFSPGLPLLVALGPARSIGRMSAPVTSMEAAIRDALATVQDPEIHRPITDLDMVESVAVDPAGAVRLGILLTVAGCPMRDKLRSDVTAAVAAVPGVTGVLVDFGVMSPEQRRDLQTKLRGPGAAEPIIPFAQPGSMTRVYGIASGKGG